MNPHRRYHPRHNPEPWPDWRYEADRNEAEYWAQMNALRWLEEHGQTQPVPTEPPTIEEDPYEGL